MVGRSRWKKEEDMDEKTTRMLFATVALSALAVLFAGPAGANIIQGDGVTARGTSSQQQAQLARPGTIPYLSQGIGVDKSLFAGKPSRQAAQAGTGLTGVHAALQSRTETPATALPHGAEVVLSPSTPQPQSLGLTGDSALTRSVPSTEPVGLTGDSAATRYLRPVSTPSTPTVTASGGDDFDWASFGAGAGMVALVAAGLGGILLAARRRHSVGLP
jgi:hypothetical protein